MINVDEEEEDHLNVGIIEVDGGRDDAMFEDLCADHGLDAPGGSKRMTNHTLWEEGGRVGKKENNNYRVSGVERIIIIIILIIIIIIIIIMMMMMMMLMMMMRLLMHDTP